MSTEVRSSPPMFEFDPPAVDPRFRQPGAAASSSLAHVPNAGRRSPFRGYSRELSAAGGILITYTEQALGWTWTSLRVFTWIVASGAVAWLNLITFDELGWETATFFVALEIAITLVVRRKLEVTHTIEIRPDAMIIDGKDVFFAEDIGDNWPAVEEDPDDPRKVVISGICGTRFVEYNSVNRIDDNDRTPEILAADLEAAMEQLWGRREVTFPTTL